VAPIDRSGGRQEPERGSSMTSGEQQDEIMRRVRLRAIERGVQDDNGRALEIELAGLAKRLAGALKALAEATDHLAR
jgi:hypothetical protein